MNAKFNVGDKVRVRKYVYARGEYDTIESIDNGEYCLKGSLGHSIIYWTGNEGDLIAFPDLLDQAPEPVGVLAEKNAEIARLQAEVERLTASIKDAVERLANPSDSERNANALIVYNRLSMVLGELTTDAYYVERLFNSGWHIISQRFYTLDKAYFMYNNYVGHGVSPMRISKNGDTVMSTEQPSAAAPSEAVTLTKERVLIERGSIFKAPKYSAGDLVFYYGDVMVIQSSDLINGVYAYELQRLDNGEILGAFIAEPELAPA